MDYRIRLCRILICAGIAGTVVASCKTGTDTSQEDQAARVDDHGADKGEPPKYVELFPDTDLGRRLRDHMIALAMPAEMPAEADRRYAESLEGLRRSPTEVADLLTAAYREIEPTRYYERWGLAKTLADLQAPAAYDTLAQIARAPLPPERNEDLHHFSTREEEVIIRLRALEGLALLAAQGHKAADADLLSLAIDRPDSNSAIQTRAIKAYLRAGPDYEARAKLLRGRLPKRMHGIVTLDVTPQKDFEARVRELASVAKEDTARDAAEERLPDAEAPAVRRTPGGQDDEN